MVRRRQYYLGRYDVVLYIVITFSNIGRAGPSRVSDVCTHVLLFRESADVPPSPLARNLNCGAISPRDTFRDTTSTRGRFTRDFHAVEPEKKHDRTRRDRSQTFDFLRGPDRTEHSKNDANSANARVHNYNGRNVV